MLLRIEFSREVRALSRSAQIDWRSQSGLSPNFGASQADERNRNAHQTDSEHDDRRLAKNLASSGLPMSASKRRLADDSDRPFWLEVYRQAPNWRNTPTKGLHSGA